MAYDIWMLSGIEPSGATLGLLTLQCKDASGAAIAVSDIASSASPISGALSDLLAAGNTTECVFSADAVRQSGFCLLLAIPAGSVITRVEMTGSCPPVCLSCTSGAVGFFAYGVAHSGVRFFGVQALSLGGIAALSPAACWPLSSSGAAQSDLMGGQAATRYGGAIVANPLEFDNTAAFEMGSGSYVRTPNISALDAASFTVVVDVQTTETGNTVIIEHGSDNSGYSVQMSPAQEVPAGYVFTAFGPQDGRLVSTFAINDGKPHRVVLVWNDATSTAALYVDGIQGYRLTNRGPLTKPRYNTSFIDVGSRGGVAPMKAGTLLSGVAVFNRALAQAEIGVLFASAPVPRAFAISLAVACSAPVDAHATADQSAKTARDIEFGGSGRIWGTTKTKGPPNQPAKARVVLLHQRSKLPVRETWSDPVTGNFAFTGIDTNQQFITLAEDAAGNFRPVAANRLTPEVLP